jgi:hypothetical protein
MVCYFNMHVPHNDALISVRCCLRSSAYTYHIEARYGSVRYRLEPDEERALRILLLKTDISAMATASLAQNILKEMKKILTMVRISGHIEQ